ncbi:BRCT domain-containing protein [Cellvibrio sp. ARAG 10.3]|uniref:BRCT domain-containing protein n=1 Tax=Cellvibrio sp. ARAG 10.3 TaxID=3451358 RepID=UPI003F458A1C
MDIFTRFNRKAIQDRQTDMLGELTNPTTLPINKPQPAITFPGITFQFTGTCAFGTRSQCQAAIETLGCINSDSVTKSLNYLVPGTYVTDSWAHETFGRKIEKAMAHRDSGVPLVIVTEEHWIGEAGLA